MVREGQWAENLVRGGVRRGEARTFTKPGVPRRTKKGVCEKRDMEVENGR